MPPTAGVGTQVPLMVTHPRRTSVLQALLSDTGDPPSLPPSLPPFLSLSLSAVLL